MKTILFFCIAAIISIEVYSQTPVPPGPISGTWDTVGSPYLIQGVTTIEDGTTLTIEPGVKVKWQNDSSSMFVMGQIVARGTESDSIVFTSANTQTTWKGIRFDNTPTGNDTSEFTYCVFNYAKAYGPFPDNCGGAITAINFGKIIIDHCYFRDNEAVNAQTDGTAGGAILLWTSSPEITNSIFKNNKSLSGAAIFCYDQSNPDILNNLFTDNAALDSIYWGNGFGGAITCNINSHPDIINNTFRNNTAAWGGGAIACVDSCNPLIKYNLIYGNEAGGVGGGIEINDYCSPILVNNTIAYNSAPDGGGIDILIECDPEIRNTILWGNTATNAGNQILIYDENSDPEFYYCDTEGGEESIGGFSPGQYEQCIDSIPMFEDPLVGNYHLLGSSPCIDAGDPSSPLDPDGSPCDIGAFYFHQIAYGYSEFSIQNTKFSIYCYPNPTQGKSEIRYQISEIRNVLLVIYDITGKQTMMLINETQAAGKYTVRFDASDLPDGLYMIRLQAGNESAVGKLLVVH